jgi:hypothetical protein
MQLLADHRDYQHNNWFADLMSFCGKIQAPVFWDLDGVHITIPSFNAAQFVACLKKFITLFVLVLIEVFQKCRSSTPASPATCPPYTSNELYLRTALNRNARKI